MRPSSRSSANEFSVEFFAIVLATVVLALWATSESQPSSGGKEQSPPTKNSTINLDKAISVQLPALARNLKPVDFRTSDGKDGWVIRIPGAHPIATPAYADGLLFVGGGYGSHEFYGIQRQDWRSRMEDLNLG